MAVPAHATRSPPAGTETAGVRAAGTQRRVTVLRIADASVAAFELAVKYACHVHMAYICMLDNSMLGLLVRFFLTLVRLITHSAHYLLTNSSSAIDNADHAGQRQHRDHRGRPYQPGPHRGPTALESAAGSLPNLCWIACVHFVSCVSMVVVSPDALQPRLQHPSIVAAF